jgi:hypothetical protein
MRVGPGMLCVSLLVLAAPAAAQLPGIAAPGHRMVRFGFGGGVSVPTSDAASALRNGINGQAYILVDTGMLPAFRFNLGYQRFDFEDIITSGQSGQSTILSGVAGMSLGLIRLGPLQPYITAGLGAFNVDEAIQGHDGQSQLRFGIDGGGGLTLRLGRLEAFIEGRMQNVYTEAGVIDTKTITSVPVTFGFLF